MAETAHFAFQKLMPSKTGAMNAALCFLIIK